jgi:RimJ/RimL family protein N-acetyltransferase
MSAATVEFEHDAVVQQLGLHIESTAPLDYCRFSESPLWALQRQYYTRRGVNAARRLQRAAHHAETPLLADSYADVILAYWEDALLTGQLDASKPVHVLELGAGGGAFTHLLLQSLSEKIAHSPLQDLGWSLLAADMVQTNLDHIQSHPKLQAWLDCGRLDTVCLDVEATAPGIVSGGGVRLDALDNPLVAVTNGLFGVLTQDLLQIHYGKLLEAHVALGRRAVPDDDDEPRDEFSRKLHRLDNPFAGIELNYTWMPADNPHWLHPDCRHLLPEYLNRLDSCSLLVPTGALSCLRYLLGVSAGRCLVLGLDYGHVQEQDLRMQSAPQLFAHGDFTLPVNRHLLHRHVQTLGGLAWASTQRDNNGPVTTALLFAADIEVFGNTEARIAERLLGTGPDDYLYLRNALTALSPPSLPPQALLSLLKMSHCDPMLLSALYPALKDAFLHIGVHERQQWCLVLQEALGKHLPDGADSTELFQLGLLALDLNDWGCALDVFVLLSERHPNDTTIAHNLALALLYTGRTNDAVHMLEQGTPTEETQDAEDANEPLLTAAREIAQHCAALPWYTPAQAEQDDLLLRPLCRLDAPALYYQYRDPAIAILTRLPTFDSIEGAAQWIEEDAGTPDKAIYGVFHRACGFIGVTSFRFVDGKGYFYFWIGSDFQNVGLGQQAAQLACRQAAALGLHTFYTSVYRDNRRSIHALERCGFEQLMLQAEEPDEDLLFYRRKLVREHNPGPVDIRQELTEFLRTIASPIQLKNDDSANGADHG